MVPHKDTQYIYEIHQRKQNKNRKEEEKPLGRAEFIDSDPTKARRMAGLILLSQVLEYKTWYEVLENYKDITNPSEELEDAEMLQEEEKPELSKKDIESRKDTQPKFVGNQSEDMDVDDDSDLFTKSKPVGAKEKDTTEKEIIEID